RSRLSDDDWYRYVMHPNADPVLTGLFTLIERSVASVQLSTLQSLGFTRQHEVDRARPYTAVKAIDYVAAVMGLELPTVLENQNDPGEISLLHVSPPAIVLGRGSIGVAMPRPD